MMLSLQLGAQSTGCEPVRDELMSGRVVDWGRIVVSLNQCWDDFIDVVYEKSIDRLCGGASVYKLCSGIRLVGV
jgi:hypothetical protein